MQWIEFVRISHLRLISSEIMFVKLPRTEAFSERELRVSERERETAYHPNSELASQPRPAADHCPFSAMNTHWKSRNWKTIKTINGVSAAPTTKHKQQH